MSENYQEREIRIRVSGSNQHNLLSVIADKLEQIHASHQLNYELLIPCRCEQCKTDPHLYPYQLLKRFIADHQLIQCRKSYVMVDARWLLDEEIDERAHLDQSYKKRSTFEFTQKRELVELLLACPSSQDIKKRCLFAMELPPHIAEMIEMCGDSKSHMLNIVNACMNHAGGLDRLFDIVEFFDGQTVQFKNLTAFINKQRHLP
ncbi:MAG: hypothetical protein GY862_03495 [Gammaproteobacteria bacterium]|nr:hypothetical protein [Gammaproteobacteria bacterium]